MATTVIAGPGDVTELRGQRIVRVVIATESTSHMLGSPGTQRTDVGVQTSSLAIPPIGKG